MRWRLALAVFCLGTACGAQPPPTAPAPLASPVTATAGQVYLQSSAGGTIQVVDAGAGRLLRTLPTGVPAPDWRRVYSLAAGTLRAVDPATGLVAATRPAPDWARDVATSANGRWLVLSGPDSRFRLQDAALASGAVDVALDGRFTFDGVSGDGRRLYLLAWLGPGAYQVRMYDVTRAALSPQVISDKEELGQPMSGQALASLPTGDGAMQLTLYQRRADGRAFVHVLPVSQDLGFAFCVDLPGPGSGWGFVGGPAGEVFYALNPEAGLVVQLTAAQGIGPPSTRDGRLDRQATAGDTPPAAVVSPDGATLYVAPASGLAAVDTRTLGVRRRALAGRHLGALAMAPDGSALYGLDGPTRLVRIDPRTLTIVSTVDLTEPAAAILRAT